MKRQYTAPEINVIIFQSADIITTSTEAFDGEWVPLGGRTSEDELLF